jgi:hypothetical protein
MHNRNGAGLTLGSIGRRPMAWIPLRLDRDVICVYMTTIENAVRSGTDLGTPTYVFLYYTYGDMYLMIDLSVHSVSYQNETQRAIGASLLASGNWAEPQLLALTHPLRQMPAPN